MCHILTFYLAIDCLIKTLLLPSFVSVNWSFWYITFKTVSPWLTPRYTRCQVSYWLSWLDVICFSCLERLSPILSMVARDLSILLPNYPERRHIEWCLCVSFVWQSVWAYTHLMQISPFKMQIFAFKIKDINLHLNAAISIQIQISLSHTDISI